MAMDYKLTVFQITSIKEHIKPVFKAKESRMSNYMSFWISQFQINKVYMYHHHHHYHNTSNIQINQTAYRE